MKKILRFALTCGALMCLSAGGHAQTATEVPPMSATQPVPADVAQMVPDFNATMSSKNMDLIMAYFSDGYLNDGFNKTRYRPYLQRWNADLRGYELQLTSFRPVSPDRAYITATMRMSGVTIGGKDPDYQMVREDGQWKWFGNQKQQ
jgi:hypothetical protein